MDKVKFSFVVPVYNVEQYLEKCVESIRNQTFSDLEIILVDDGSKDRSRVICDSYAQENSQIKVIHKENGGLSSARNAGISRAEGQYIIFVDSDDYVERDMCKKLAEYLERYPEVDAISIDGWEHNENEKRRIRRVTLEQAGCFSGEQYLIHRYSQTNMNVEAWLYVFRRDFLLRSDLRFKEGILHEDVEFTPRVLEQASQVLEVPDAYYHYMIRENSISTQKNKEKNIRDLFRTLQNMDERAEQMQDPELKRWTKNAVLNSYLNMIYDAKMYRPEYRKWIDKSFLKGKAATRWNFLRVCLCVFSVRGYCKINELYKRIR